MEISNNLKINEYVSMAQLKRKIKTYLIEQGNSDFKPSIFAKGLIVSLVMVLEELVGDCLKSISKEKTGLYTINKLILSNLFSQTDKYDFTTKYMRKFSSSLRYHDSIFFNYNKVITNLEDKHGSKLMIDSEAKNIIAYIILSLQYDIIELSVNMVKYAGRKTLNINVLDIVCSYILSNDFSSKIKLKLDSINISNKNDENENDDDDDDSNDDDDDDDDDSSNNGDDNSDNGNDDDSNDDDGKDDKKKLDETVNNTSTNGKNKKLKESKENKIVKETIEDNKKSKSKSKSKSKI